MDFFSQRHARMRLERIGLRNFRLLRRLSIDLTRDKTTTVLVGPNNSGKTSVMDALQLFLESGGVSNRKFSIHDFSQVRRHDFSFIQQRIEKIVNDKECIKKVRRLAPRIRLDLIFSYDEGTADLVVATKLLMNLDPKSNIVGFRIEFALNNAKALITDFKSRRSPDETLFQFLSGNLLTYYGLSFFKISEDGVEAESLKNGDIIKPLIKVDKIPAQRFIDDEESSRAAKLSKLLHDHYNLYYKSDDLEGYNSIEDVIKTAATDLTTKYDGAFGRLKSRLQSFGYPTGQTSPQMRIKAELSAETVYRDSTRVYYESDHVSVKGVRDKYELPERYNGLGYKNLIYIILKLESFRAALEVSPSDRPRVHIITIEEPEAYLHPQVQCVFIREISKVLKATEGAHPQVILSTHSSHMVADSGFDPIRYFKRRGNKVSVRDLSRLNPPDGDVLSFLKRYVKLTHCDLFFADKAILVEGQVEKLLLPMMLEKCAELDGSSRLASQYISISEVGGAHAHKFKPLVDFLGIPTLIITDIDTVDDNGKKCPVVKGKTTSNAALKNWIPAKKTRDDLLAAGEDVKTIGLIRVAYQTTENDACGRSFEEAFLYANIDWLKGNHKDLEATGARIKKVIDLGLFDNAYGLCASLPKVDFALDLVALNGWVVPLYINEGLKWLAEQEHS